MGRGRAIYYYMYCGENERCDVSEKAGMLFVTK